MLKQHTSLNSFLNPHVSGVARIVGITVNFFLLANDMVNPAGIYNQCPGGAQQIKHQSSAYWPFMCVHPADQVPVARNIEYK